MTFSLFDNYDLRTRVSVLVLFASPFILDAYILIESLRALSGTVLIVTILLAFSCLFTCWIRFFGKNVVCSDYISIFLSNASSKIGRTDKARYFSKISQLEPSFTTLLGEPELDASQLKSVSYWLRNKMRDDKYYLVKQEGMNFGFLRNALSVKAFFLVVFSLYSIALLLVVFIGMSFEQIQASWLSTLSKYYACILVHIVSYCIWIFGVTKKLFLFVAEKYAIAVISSIDNLS